LARREKKLLKYLASAICLVLGILLIVDSKRMDPESGEGAKQIAPGQGVPGGQPKAEKSPTSNSWVSDFLPGSEVESTRSGVGELCRTVLDSCTAKIAFVSEDCNEKAARVEVDQLLENPLKNLHCQNMYSRIESECPSGCRFDSSRSVVLPGSIQFFFDDEASESGCEVTGERQVNIRATCVGEG